MQYSTLPCVHAAYSIHTCMDVTDVCHIELPVGETVAAAPAKKMDQREKESGLVTLAI